MLRGGSPMAATLKVTVSPAYTVWLTGCLVTKGGPFPFVHTATLCQTAAEGIVLAVQLPPFALKAAPAPEVESSAIATKTPFPYAALCQFPEGETEAVQ